MILLAAIAIAVLICVMVRKHFERNWMKGLEIKLGFLNKGVTVNEIAVLEEEVVNRKKMGLPVLEIKYTTDNSFKFDEKRGTFVSDRLYRKDVYSIKGMQHIKRKMEFRPTKRGFFGVSSCTVIARDYFMKNIYMCEFEADTHIYVFPRRVDTAFYRPFYRRMMGEVVSEKRPEEDPFCFRAIREYIPGDPIKQVNWKATAATDSLMVNSYESTGSNRICIVLDGNTAAFFDDEFIVEGGISLASSLVARFIRSNLPVALYSNLPDTLTGKEALVDYASTSVQEERVDTALARVKRADGLRPISEIFTRALEEGGKEAAYVLISSDRISITGAVAAEVEKKGFGLNVIVPYSKREHDRIFDGGEISSLPGYYCPWEVPEL